MEPVIGIVCCGFEENRQFLPNTYIQSVRYSGGIPVMIPLVRSDRLIDRYIDLCDGFLFCGGGDITPLLFREHPMPGNGATDITLDIFQLRLMKRVLSLQKPVVGICRGMQILNVACGGTIWQDLSLCPHATLNHMQNTPRRSDISHRIRTEPESRLRRWIGPVQYVNSFHHQAVNTAGSDLIPGARSPDGVIEAIEHVSHPFAFGVQWHPECMYRTSKEMRTLFRKFVKHSSASSGLCHT